jgi:AGZA family xanthine/uracil permease-like MFS transporter
MKPYRWAAWGDVNAFFGLMLDNVAVMVFLVSTISSSTPPEEQKGRYSFTPQFVITRMIPGTALGVLIGDLVYTWMAFRLARRTGRSDITAMPLGLDTPSTFGIGLLVLLPALQQGRVQHGMNHDTAMLFAWHVGLTILVFVGLFKVCCAPLGNAVRRWVPRAGLLGSLAAIALALIAFVPLWLDIAAMPLVGMLSLTLILVTLLAHRSLPGNVPGAFAAVGVGVLAYLVFGQFGNLLHWNLVSPPHQAGPASAWQLPSLMPEVVWDRVWWERVGTTALAMMPVALPFALATIVGGIDCTESAAAAGDEYDTRTILLTEGVASVLAGLCGGVIQNTPYIGHPAYKAMGGRAAYTLATALFVAAVGYFGWFRYLFEWLPEAAMFPILVYVGLEITAQSFRATPVRHYPALAIAALPALAYLATIPLNRALAGRDPDPDAAAAVQTLRCLANGFLVTGMLWAAALAALLDGQLLRAALYNVVTGIAALFGVIHSPLPGAPIALPGTVFAQLPEEARFQIQSPYHWAAAYWLTAALLAALALGRPRTEDRGQKTEDRGARDRSTEY